jgi:predicted TIM-barrel enzyme
MALRSLTDGVILTGKATGKAVNLEILEQACHVARSFSLPLYVGSGAHPDDLPLIRKYGAGVIVSSALRKDGRAGAPLDLKRIKNFVNAFYRKKLIQKTKKTKLGAKKRR